jgi:hypothetical protein
MDFGTMMQNLNSNKYSTVEEFTRDVELVFSNCRLFNPATTYPVQCVDVLERVFKKEWTRAADKKMPWSEKRSLQSLMTTLVKDQLYVLIQSRGPITLITLQSNKVICFPGTRRPNRSRDSTVSRYNTPQGCTGPQDDTAKVRRRQVRDA